VGQLGEIRTPVGKSVAVGVKVAVAAGVVRRFLLGEPGEQRFEVLAGNLVDRTAAAEQLLRPGETAAGAEIIGSFGAALHVREWRATASKEHFAIVGAMGEEIAPSPWLNAPEIDVGVASDWLLKPVYERLKSVEGQFLAELRPVVTFFLSFAGINYERDDDAGQKLYDYVAWLHAVLAHYEGHLLQLVIGDKGSYCFIAFGALHSHEDDAARAIAAAVALRLVPDHLSFIQDTRIGISLGALHVGAYGSSARRTFGVNGNETNVAARLMSAAQPGDILVSSKVARSAAKEFDFIDLGRIELKGLTQRVPVLAVAGRRRQDPRHLAAAAPDSRAVGREHETSILLQRLNALRAGNSGAVLIDGEAGIGKSRLLVDFLHEASQAGIRVLASSGDAIEQNTPYFAWRPIFRTLFGIEDGEAPVAAREKVIAALPDDADTLELLPLLDTVLNLQLPENSLTAQMTGEARANSTRNLLLKVLSSIALSSGPLLLAFDDAHWLDSASSALLAQARRVLSPVLFVFVTRPAVSTEAAQKEYERLLNAPDVEQLRLTTLSQEQVVHIICLRLGVTELPPVVAAFIYRHSEGHPFFSEEIAFALRDAGYIRVEDGRCVLANGELGDIDFPVTIQGVVTSRIDRLDSSQQLTLKVASVIGRIFAVRVLHNIYPVTTASDFLPAQLSSLERLDIILRESPPPDLSYVFKHNITQEVIYNLMTFSQRQQLHRNAAQWYESRHADDLSPYYALLAHHWSKAEDTARAIKYLEKAGEEALRNFANEEAVTFFSQALSMDASADDTTEPLRRGLWEIKTGEAYVHWTRYAEGRAHLERGLALLGMPVPYTSSPLRNGLYLLGAMLKQAAHRTWPHRYVASRAADQGILLAASRAYSRLVEVYFHSGETLLSVHAAFHTLNLAELAGDSAELAEAYAPIGAFFSFLRLYGIADAYFARALNVAERVQSLPARSFVLLTKGTYETGIGNWQQARAAIEELIESGQRLGAQRRYNDGLQLKTILLYSLGDFRSCIEVGDKLLISARQLNDLRFQGYGLYARAFGSFHLGHVDAAATLLQELQRLFDASDGVTDTQLALIAQGLWCLIHLQQNDQPAALESAAQASQLAEGPFQVSYWTLPGYAGPAEVFLTAWEIGHGPPGVEQHAQKALKTLNRFSRTFPIGRPSAMLYQGWQHVLCGRPKRALRTWQSGLQLALDGQLPYEATRLHYEMGRSQNLDGMRRQEHLREAQAGFDKLGSAHGMQAVRSALASDGKTSPPLFTSAATD
ncbi:MAG TPA: AAA family ATPase, partial [Candidatus Binatia bacterium]|nr:AAA family ATPase [Candidatus Binatia bacterium]